MTEQELREMPLHDVVDTIDGDVVTRVPGGWIYELLTVTGAAVFVPDPAAWADAIAFALRRGDPIPVELKAGTDETGF